MRCIIFTAAGTTVTHDYFVVTNFDNLHRFLDPYFSKGFMMEPTWAWFEDKKWQMIVDEDARMRGLNQNDTATRLYRYYWMQRFKDGQSMQDLPNIVGAAAIFERNVL